MKDVNSGIQLKYLSLKLMEKEIYIFPPYFNIG